MFVNRLVTSKETKNLATSLIYLSSSTSMKVPFVQYCSGS